MTKLNNFTTAEASEIKFIRQCLLKNQPAATIMQAVADYYKIQGYKVKAEGVGWRVYPNDFFNKKLKGER